MPATSPLTTHGAAATLSWYNCSRLPVKLSPEKGILGHGADVGAEDDAGDRPVDHARSRGYTQLVQLLETSR